VRQKLCRRLVELEKISARARRARVCNARESAIAKLREILCVHDVQQSPNESLAEAFARFLGMSSRELRNRLMARAVGGWATQ
jgi:hypothetical protein